MERPVNVFWNFYNLLKDLVVSVKLGSSKAVPNGSVLEQLSDTTFKVTDNEGNEGVCELVNKNTNELNDNEMSLMGIVLHSSAFVYIASIVNNLMIDFNNSQYSWDLEHDSTTNVLMLTGK
mgnify:FL=1|jgi:hypothetical protein